MACSCLATQGWGSILGKPCLTLVSHKAPRCQRPPLPLHCHQPGGLQEHCPRSAVNPQPSLSRSVVKPKWSSENFPIQVIKGRNCVRVTGELKLSQVNVSYRNSSGACRASGPSVLCRCSEQASLLGLSSSLDEPISVAIPYQVKTRGLPC